jgi:ferredoxin
MIEKKALKVEDIRTDADAIQCPVERALYYVSEFLAGPMCGKCFPCSMGSYEAKILLRTIVDGKGTENDLFRLKRIAGEMVESSMCKKGKDTARFLLEWLDSDVFQSHIDGTCPARTCAAFIEYRIIADKCTLCGICKDVCKYNAIHGEKVKPFLSGYLPFEIRQTKCVKCGDCINVCPENAIVLIDVKSREPVQV